MWTHIARPSCQTHASCRDSRVEAGKRRAATLDLVWAQTNRGHQSPAPLNSPIVNDGCQTSATLESASDQARVLTPHHRTAKGRRISAHLAGKQSVSRAMWTHIALPSHQTHASCRGSHVEASKRRAATLDLVWAQTNRGHQNPAPLNTPIVNDGCQYSATLEPESQQGRQLNSHPSGADGPRGPASLPVKRA